MRFLMPTFQNTTYYADNMPLTKQALDNGSWACSPVSPTVVATISSRGFPLKLVSSAALDLPNASLRF